MTIKNWERGTVAGERRKRVKGKGAVKLGQSGLFDINVLFLLEANVLAPLLPVV